MVSLSVRTTTITGRKVPLPASSTTSKVRWEPRGIYPTVAAAWIFVKALGLKIFC
jgi:hypothetical protein